MKGDVYLEGTVYAYIDKVLSKYKFYQDYRKGIIQKDEYIQQLDAHKDLIIGEDISLERFNTVKRTPIDEEAPTELVLEQLYKAGVIHTKEYNRKSFDEYREKIKAKFQHGKYSTSIFPEEERIAYALSMNLKPSQIFEAGSYYGYWSSWMWPGLDSSGNTVLSDIDPETIKLAKVNIEGLGFNKNAQAICEDSKQLLLKDGPTIDLLVLDAVGKKDDPCPLYRGKAIYGSIVKAALHRMKSGSVILAHNINRHNEALYHFFKVVDPITIVKIETETTNGVSVYVLR